MSLLSNIWKMLTYSPYTGEMLNFLIGRESVPMACAIDNIPSEVIDRTLMIICESFDIADSQKYCLRLDDNLGDIYRAMTKYSVHDDFEYERLALALEKWLGKSNVTELFEDINCTVREVIVFAATELHYLNSPSTTPESRGQD